MRKLTWGIISLCLLLPAISFAESNGIGRCVSDCVDKAMLNTDNATACVEFCKNHRGEGWK